MTIRDACATIGRTEHNRHRDVLTARALLFRGREVWLREFIRGPVHYGEGLTRRERRRWF